MRQYYKKKLSDQLEIAPDEGYIQLLWAANALQSGLEAAAAPYLRYRYPHDAVTQQITQPTYIQKWELETIANELLTAAKRTKPKRGITRELDCTSYVNVMRAVNSLRKLENHEAGLGLNRPNILDEMGRIANRQFDWQRGWFNFPQFYRTAYIYGQGDCAEAFEAKHGITLNSLSLVGFCLYTHLTQHPLFPRAMDLSGLGIDVAERERALQVLSIPISEARRTAISLRASQQIVAYKPSLLRQYPCIGFGDACEKLRAPLPQLIIERITSGIFYDVVDGGGIVRADYGKRFESYTLAYLRATLPECDLRPEQQYGSRAQSFDTPDILWLDGGDVDVAIECKASRMSFEAKFGLDPSSVRGFDDIVKAVFQLWRFFSHCRRGLIHRQVRENATGLVLTLDDWLLMAGRLQDKVLVEATALAAARDQEVIEADRRPIAFCSIMDLERVLVTASAASLRTAVAEAATQQYRGWMLDSIHERSPPPSPADRPYPFRDDLEQLLPWWGLRLGDGRV